MFLTNLLGDSVKTDNTESILLSQQGALDSRCLILLGPLNKVIQLSVPGVLGWGSPTHALVTLGLYSLSLRVV